MKITYYLVLLILLFAQIGPVSSQPKDSPQSANRLVGKNPSPIPTNISPAGTPTPVPEALTVNDVLVANNHAVTQIATMYRDIVLLITLMVAVAGYLGRKTVLEFLDEWNKKLESVETDMKTSKASLSQAVKDAEASALEAKLHSQSIIDSEAVLNKALLEVDRLRIMLSNLPDGILDEIKAQNKTTEPMSSSEVSDSINKETVSADEMEQVMASLKNKLPNQKEGSTNE